MEGAGMRTRRRHWSVAILTVALLGLPAVPRVAEAQKLKDSVKSLYGGDGILLQPTAPPFPSHAPHFTVTSLQGLDQLNQAISSNLGIVSLNSSATGFTLDIERGVPIRSTENLGPLLAERAPTLGARKLNLGLFYTRADFKRLAGKDLDNLTLVFTHEDVNGDGIIGNPEFELDQIEVDLDVELSQDIVALFATYGITSSWDVSAVIPIVHTHMRVRANARIVRNSSISRFVHNFGPQGDQPVDTGGGDATGIGDILLRTKYHFFRSESKWPDLAMVGQVKLATGDEDDLLGTGHTNFLALLVASRTYGRFTPHVNVGYEVTTGPSDQDNLRYVVGVDAALHPRFTLSGDILGRWAPERSGNGANIVDFALSAKWNVWRSLLLDAVVQIPINKDEGLRADVIWTVGVEYTF
jgi:Putative MetA-pathway of phenol degradation